MGLKADHFCKCVPQGASAVIPYSDYTMTPLALGKTAEGPLKNDNGSNMQVVSINIKTN